MNRETWLNKAKNIVSPWFDEAGFPLPEHVRVSCGFPSNGKRSKAIGECWDKSVSGDDTFEIFINPNQDESMRVVDILIHELIHAAVGLEAGHKGPFKRLAHMLGLEGKMTATVAGDILKERIEKEIITAIGRYPHAILSAASNAPKKQSTRLIKAECNTCGYVIRTTRKWAELGLPTCRCGGEFEEA